jgi:hypothetical protein
MKEVSRKNGERGRSAQADRLRASAWAFTPQSVRATSGRSIDHRIPIAVGRARRASDRGDARVGGAVSEVRLPPDPGELEAAWFRDERRSGVSTVEAGRASSPPAPTKKTRCNGKASTASRQRCQPFLRNLWSDESKQGTPIRSVIDI